MESRKENVGEGHQEDLFGEGETVLLTVSGDRVSTDCIEFYKLVQGGAREWAIDTETTGLFWFKGHKPFAITATNGKNTFYFNLHENHPNFISDPAPIRAAFDLIDTLIFANAKFDMHMLAYLCSDWSTKVVHDVLVRERLVYNADMSYSLESVAKKYGREKSKQVEEYIKKYKLYDKEKKGNKGTRNIPRYDLVPYRVIAPYAVKDVEITWHIYKEQEKNDVISTKEVTRIETSLTPVLWNMERRGIKIDKAYCQEAYKYSVEEYTKAEKTFEEEAKHKFEDSPILLSKLLQERGATLATTDKGNFDLDEESLIKVSNDYPECKLICDSVLTYREHYKRAHTYFGSFLQNIDADDRLHASFKQAGTISGRMSMVDPNLQNITKRGDKEAKYPVRRSFIAYNSDEVLVAIDYKAFEFCAMLEYAGQKDLAEKVAAGHDPHQATADMTGLDRFSAKSYNFMKIYGGGIAKTAEMLGVSVEQARTMSNNYFKALPKVQALIRGVTNKAETRKYVFNKFGRRSHFPDSKFVYKATNALIQGVTADAVKNAMVKLSRSGLLHYMLLQIHDEILFSVPKEHVHPIIAQASRIMVDSYPVEDEVYKMQVEASIGTTWGDMEKYRATL